MSAVSMPVLDPVDTVDVDVDIFCHKCSNSLEFLTEISEASYWSSSRSLTIYVKPCEECLTQVDESAYKRGYTDGISDGATE